MTAPIFPQLSQISLFVNISQENIQNLFLEVACDIRNYFHQLCNTFLEYGFLMTQRIF